MRSLAFLFSSSRERVLSLLLLHPESAYHVREIARISETSAGSLHRELAMLADSGVLLRETRGNQVTYQANVNFPIFNELSSILKKTSGVANVILSALLPLASKIDCVFIYGSVAKNTESPLSDIDLCVIGAVSYTEIISALYETQELLHREINAKVLTRPEWRQLLEGKSSFANELISQPKIFVIGNKDEFGKFSRN